ncbi:MAG: hypothetical protein MUE74_09090 [Bacteroidales bacterium]|jgi:hypothetical protein|nr:hypothetical protein [Bacteroidales bacterium]
MYDLILPLGIINIVLVALQVLGGLKIIKISFKTHKYLGIMLGIFALIHGALAVFFT